MHIKPHTEESKLKMSIAHTGIPNFARRRETAVFGHRNGSAYFGWVRNEFETWHFDSGFLRQLEVIGDIHDNQELLESGDENGQVDS